MAYTIPSEKKDYFCIEEYRECGLQKPGGITIINGGRDIGKTTGTLIYDLERASSTEQLFFIRNTEKELKQYAKSFNAKWQGKYIMVGEGIYKVIVKQWVEKKTGEMKTSYGKGECIGFMGALSGVDGWRSGIFDYIKYIYVDEYNQIGNTLNAEKFMTLWTSIVRHKPDIYTTIVGNRDDVAADLLIELGLDLIVPEDYKGDFIVPLLPDDKDFADKAFFIDLDDNRFNVINNPTIWRALGRKMGVMGKYYDRGYKSYDNIDCKKLDKAVLDRIKWKFSYNFDETKLLVGELNGVTVCHWDKENDYKEIEIKLADVPFCAKNTGYQPIEDNIDLAYFTLMTAMKNKTILYTSIYIKEITVDFSDDLAYAMHKRKKFTL